MRYNPHTFLRLKGCPLFGGARRLHAAPRVAKEQAPRAKSPRAPYSGKSSWVCRGNYACQLLQSGVQICRCQCLELVDVEHFLVQLDGRWITDAPESIELWGGSRFLYWAKIRRVIPALAEPVPAARFSHYYQQAFTPLHATKNEKLDFIAALMESRSRSQP